MNKREIIKVVTTNIVIAVITTFVVMIILKVNLNFENFNFFFLVSIVTFILGNLIFLMKQ
jgi:hypothetical protein